MTDAWEPQVNGVVNALRNLRKQLAVAGHDVLVISPDQFLSVPCPTYPEIRLAFPRSAVVGERIAGFGADAVHIVTEGPLCLAARRWCLRNGVPFTTAYCTNFPAYLAQRTGLPPALFWVYFRWFHKPSRGVMGSTPSVRQALRDQGLTSTREWGRGVDLENFAPDAPIPEAFAGLAGPILLYVGRVAIEKNIGAFLACRHPGTKVVVGDGPARADLARAYPSALFLGKLAGRALAGAYAGADVLVFPSRTDTFGVVMIEALACGTPVAAYPVNGPIDIVTSRIGALDENLDRAIARALRCDRAACADFGRSFSWEASTRQFLQALAPAAQSRRVHDVARA